jgi:hypothetical protein
MFPKASGFRLWYFQKYLLKRITNQEYLYQCKFSSFENILQDSNKQNYFGNSEDIKLDYSPNIKENGFITYSCKLVTTTAQNSINSTTTSNNTLFETISNSDNSSLKQYIEWHKVIMTIIPILLSLTTLSKKHSTSWFFTNQLLSGFIPLQTDSQYHLEQIKRFKTIV